MQLINDLNTRWAAGRASATLADAGVVMRVFDGQETRGKPWMPDATSPIGDHFAVSIVSARHPDVYEGGNGPPTREPGMVFASTPMLQERISCAYNRDAASNNKQCHQRGGDEHCRPGCAKYWCEGGRKWNCAYRPEQLVDALQRQDAELPNGHVPGYGYNEIVLDAWRTPWRDALPDAVVAFWVQPLASQEEKQRAKDAHSAYVDDADISSSPAGRATPLLHYDPLSAREPFSVFIG